jgi:hypothetical protein
MRFQICEAFAFARAPRNFRFAIAVKPGFVAIDCGHEIAPSARIGEFSIAKAQSLGRIFEVKS